MGHQMQSDRNDRWDMSPYVLVRMSGADQDALQQLRVGRSVEHVNRLWALENWLAANRDHVCDEVLYRLIGETDGAVKSQMVGIRRRLYNGKLPRMQEMLVLRHASCARSRRLVLRYYSRLRRYQSLKSGDRAAYAREIFKAELLVKREDLVRHLSDDKFLKALQVASPSLADGVGKLLQKPPTQWAKKERQIEGRAIRYLTRMLAKTSPFGRFGPVALGRYDPASTSCIRYDFSDFQVETRSSLNLSFVDKVISRLWRHPDAARHVPVRINQSYFFDNGDLCFYQPYEKNNYPKYTFLRRGRFIREIQLVLECIENADAPMNSWQIAKTLHEQGMGEGWQDQAKVHQLVESLIASGLLIRQWPLATSRQDRIDDLFRMADQAGFELPGDWREDVDLLRRCGNAFSGQTVRDRDKLIQKSDAILERLLDEQSDLRSRIARDRRLYVEDSYVRGGDFTLGAPFWSAIRDDVGAFLDLIFRRDGGGLGHQMFKDIFIQHYGVGGECASLTKFANELSKTAFRTDALATSAFVNSSAVNQNALHYLQTLMDMSSASGDARECDIGQDGCRAMAERFPAEPPGRKSIALHLQIVAESQQQLDAGDFDVVLNYTLPGHGRFFTRYCEFFDAESPGAALSDELKLQLDRLAESLGGVEIIEVLSVVNHNAQVHRPMTERVIVAPGEVSPYGDDRDIEPRELVLRHDARSNTMGCYLGGKEVMPMYMGFFHSMSLPYSHRVLVDCSPHSYHAERNKVAEFQENLVPFTRPEQERRKIRHYPRIRCGRLIVQRETWSVDVEAIVPEFIEVEDDFDMFVRANLWRMRSGLPAACFVRVKRKKDNPSEVYNQINPNEHKPMFLDFENVFTLKSFVSMISTQGVQSVQFEESLPAIGATPLKIGGKPVAMELQIEVNRG